MRLPKIFSQPEFMHDCVLYTWPEASETKRDNWAKMKRFMFNTRDFTAPGFPFVLQIEPTSRCNLACPLCPAGRNELDRPRRDMTVPEFKMIIDDMHEYLLYLVLWDWGEPLMNPDLPEMVRYAYTKGIQSVTSTNGHFLKDEAYVREILTSGLGTLIVAIDSLDAQNYEIYRKNGKLADTLAGLHKLMELKRELNSPTVINLRMVIMSQNENEIARLNELAKELQVDLFSVKTLNPSCGSDAMDDDLVPTSSKFRRYKYEGDSLKRIRREQHCDRVWYMSNIFSNGDVVPCCYDYNAELKIGNVFEKPFSQMWNGKEYTDLRKRIYEDKNRFSKCEHCGINFLLNRKDWFVDAKIYNPDFGFKRHLINLPGGYRVRHFLHQLRGKL